MRNSGLFFERRDTYVDGMRIAMFIVLMFCAVISGWTVSLARVQHFDDHALSHTMAAAHAEWPAGGHHPASDGKEHCAATAQDCDHHPPMAHPLLCAACFAITLEAPALDRDKTVRAGVRPQLQRPLHAATLEPQFPPPKRPA